MPLGELLEVQELPPPQLLGAFDPLLLGWASRDPITGPHQRIVTVNGQFRPFALAGGRAVATWTIAGGQIALAHAKRITAVRTLSGIRLPHHSRNQANGRSARTNSDRSSIPLD